MSTGFDFKLYKYNRDYQILFYVSKEGFMGKLGQLQM